MSTKTNFSPVEYLERRVIYYKKKRGIFRTAVKNGSMSKWYSDEDLKNGIETIEQRIEEYKVAISKLKK